MGVKWPLGEFTGLFAERGQPGYEAARTGRVFNARHPDRYPAAVLLAADDAEVAGVRWARERGRGYPCGRRGLPGGVERA